MRRWFAVALLALASCGSESGSNPALAAFCETYCGEDRAGPCWPAKDGGPAQCEANCLDVALSQSDREKCVWEETTPDACASFTVCMPLAPDSYWQERW